MSVCSDVHNMRHNMQILIRKCCTNQMTCTQNPEVKWGSEFILNERSFDVFFRGDFKGSRLPSEVLIRLNLNTFSPKPKKSLIFFIHHSIWGHQTNATFPVGYITFLQSNITILQRQIYHWKRDNDPSLITSFLQPTSEHHKHEIEPEQYSLPSLYFCP